MTDTKQQNRRNFIRNIATGSAGAIAFSGLSFGKNNEEQMTAQKDYSKRARKIVKKLLGRQYAWLLSGRIQKDRWKRAFRTLDR